MNHREELEALVELAQAGNMRQAADTLGISQSTLSECITRLEAVYGAALFERDRRGSHPTVYGKVVVNAAGHALRVMREAQREIGLIKGSASGRLAIGAEPGLIEPYLTTAIVRGLARYPDLRYRLLALDSSTLVQEVRDKRIEFFLGVRPDGPTGGLVLSEIAQSGSVPFVRSGHPLTTAKRLTLGEIMRYPVVQGPGPRWFVRRIADELELEIGSGTRRGRAAVVVNDFGVVRALVRQSDAVGFALAAMLQGEFERHAFVPLEVPREQAALLRFPLLIGTLANRALPPAAHALIEEIKQVVSEFDGP
ncbi:MAG: LysR family transcriptional regulator [Gammaproteobacteria bacterium]